MGLKSRKKVVLAKIETSYGVDPTPTGAANAILTRRISIVPLESELERRELVRTYYGNDEELHVATYKTIEFDVELAGAGGAGAIPAYGPLLRGCAFSQTALTAAITSITRVGQVATATKAAHGHANGDSVVISGAAETEYNGTFVISNVTTNTFDYTVTGTPVTPATGTPVLGVHVVYAPVSAAEESLTLYFNVDGVLHKMLGARGSVKLMLDAKKIPYLTCSFTGLYVAIADATLPTATLTGFVKPVPVNNTNTTGFALHGYAAAYSALSLDVANQVVYRHLVGQESVLITDRKPTGSVTIEAPTIAQKDYFTSAINATTAPLSVTHGTVGGNKVKIDAPKVQITKPAYSEQDQIEMLQMGMNFIPGAAGNDELTLTVY